MAKPRKRDTATVLDERSGVSNADRDRVAARAYELYTARGGQDGMDLEDWFQAERELANGGNRDDGNSGHGV